LDEAGTGTVSIGKTHMGSVTRDDVAEVLSLLADRPHAKGLALDLVGGPTPISEALDAAISKGESDFQG